jgi:hypothetical protein
VIDTVLRDAIKRHREEPCMRNVLLLEGVCERAGLGAPERLRELGFVLREAGLCAKGWGDQTKQKWIPNKNFQPCETNEERAAHPDGLLHIKGTKPRWFCWDPPPIGLVVERRFVGHGRQVHDSPCVVSGCYSLPLTIPNKHESCPSCECRLLHWSTGFWIVDEYFVNQKGRIDRVSGPMTDHDGFVTGSGPGHCYVKSDITIPVNLLRPSLRGLVRA